MYREVVESYMSRDMTFQGDILHAFKGVALFMHTLSAWDTPNGITNDVVDNSLPWRPKGVLGWRFKCNGYTQTLQSANFANDLAIPTYSWAAWLGPATYHPTSFTLRSLVPRFETSTPGSKIRHIPRYAQSREMSKSLDLELQNPWAPTDRSIAQDFGKTLKWAAPQARSLAFRMHLVDDPKMSTKDGPAILQFIAHCIKLSLSRDQDTIAAPTGRAKADNERCKVMPLLNMYYQRIGFVWHVPLLDELGMRMQEVEVVQLSKYKATSKAVDKWIRDSEVSEWHEWCLINVMLVRGLTGGGPAERVTIGKVHEGCAGDGEKEVVRLV